MFGTGRCRNHSPQKELEIGVCVFMGIEGAFDNTSFDQIKEMAVNIGIELAILT